MWLGIGLLTGAIVAGATTVFLAPTSGPEFRTLARERAARAKDWIVYRAREEARAKNGDKRKK